MGLMPYLSPEHPSIQAGIRYLLDHQTSVDLTSATMGVSPFQQESDLPALTWSPDAWTGTGLPDHLYIGYSLYKHYFPMMAIREFLRACEQEKDGTKVNISFD